MAMTLDDIRSSIATKYASFQFEDFELLNPLRLSKLARAEMASLYETTEVEVEEGEDPALSDDEILDREAEKYGRLMEIAASPATRTNVRGFLNLIADDDDRLLILTEIMEAYTREQQVGEA